MTEMRISNILQLVVMFQSISVSYKNISVLWDAKILVTVLHFVPRGPFICIM